jgi:hypothetical protein
MLGPQFQVPGHLTAILNHAPDLTSFPSDSFPPFGLLGLGARGPDWRFMGLGPCGAVKGRISVKFPSILGF